MPYNGRRFNVTRREEYTDRAGNKKTKWITVGAVFFEQDEQKAMLKLDMFGEPYYLFPPKEKEGEASW